MHAWFCMHACWVSHFSIIQDIWLLYFQNQENIEVFFFLVEKQQWNFWEILIGCKGVWCLYKTTWIDWYKPLPWRLLQVTFQFLASLSSPNVALTFQWLQNTQGIWGYSPLNIFWEVAYPFVFDQIYIDAIFINSDDFFRNAIN